MHRTGLRRPGAVSLAHKAARPRSVVRRRGGKRVAAKRRFVAASARGRIAPMDFVDLQGHSGRVYRFRRLPAASHLPPIAGNYAVLRRDDRQIVALGVSENLADTRQEFSRLVAGLEAFTRLNISRAHREAEHADLYAAHPTAAAPSAGEVGAA